MNFTSLYTVDKKKRSIKEIIYHIFQNVVVCCIVNNSNIGVISKEMGVLIMTDYKLLRAEIHLGSLSQEPHLAAG